MIIKTHAEDKPVCQQYKFFQKMEYHQQNKKGHNWNYLYTTTRAKELSSKLKNPWFCLLVPPCFFFLLNNVSWKIMWLCWWQKVQASGFSLVTFINKLVQRYQTRLVYGFSCASVWRCVFCAQCMQESNDLVFMTHLIENICTSCTSQDWLAPL